MLGLCERAQEVALVQGRDGEGVVAGDAEGALEAGEDGLFAGGGAAGDGDEDGRVGGHGESWRGCVTGGLGCGVLKTTGIL